jgi:hypothetical protein
VCESSQKTNKKPQGLRQALGFIVSVCVHEPYGLLSASNKPRKSSCRLLIELFPKSVTKAKGLTAIIGSSLYATLDERHGWVK